MLTILVLKSTALAKGKNILLSAALIFTIALRLSFITILGAWLFELLTQ